MAETPFTFISQGEQLVGMTHYADEWNGTTILMCHGFTEDKAESNRLFVEAAREFAQRGYHAVRFDFFGSGDSAGEFRESRISINMQNLKDAITHVRISECRRLVVLGMSMGAATAILTAMNQPVEGLVLWSTVPDMKELFMSRLELSEAELGDMESLEYEGWLIEGEFYIDAIQYDIMAAVKRLTLPKLFVQGCEDDPVFQRGFERFKEAAPAPSEFELIDGAGHTYETVRHRKEIIARTCAWLNRNFG
jgi:alpha-beta hydrolase superfamily lysophospholipase